MLGTEIFGSFLHLQNLEITLWSQKFYYKSLVKFFGKPITNTASGNIINNKNGFKDFAESVFSWTEISKFFQSSTSNRFVKNTYLKTLCKKK